MRQTFNFLLTNRMFVARFSLVGSGITALFVSVHGFGNLPVNEVYLYNKPRSGRISVICLVIHKMSVPVQVRKSSAERDHSVSYNRCCVFSVEKNKQDCKPSKSTQNAMIHQKRKGRLSLYLDNRKKTGMSPEKSG